MKISLGSKTRSGLLSAVGTYAKNCRSHFRSSLCLRDHAGCHRQLTVEQPSVFPVD